MGCSSARSPAYHLAVADWLGGRLEAAERALAEVVAERLAAGERYLAVRAGWDLGHLQQAQGRLGAALRTYQHGLETATGAGHARLPAAGMAQVGMAEVLHERDELAAASPASSSTHFLTSTFRSSPA